MTQSAALLKELLKNAENLKDAFEGGAYPAKDAVGFGSLCDAALAQCADTVEKFRHAHNAGLPHARLPREIWCLIWSHLPDVIVITHVCRAWRTLAIDYVLFWTHIPFFSMVHEDGESCSEENDCECYEADYGETPWRKGIPTPSHNLGQVETYLKRSKSAPITLKVCIWPMDTDLRLATQLAAIVMPHARRVTSLDFTFGDDSFFVKFMEYMKELPELSVLHMDHNVDRLGNSNPWPCPMSTLQLEDFGIPRLREFHAFFFWDIPQSPRARSFSALEHLQCCFSDARSLYHCLGACPKLVSLEAWLSDHTEIGMPAEPADDNLCPCLQELFLSDMTPPWQAALQRIISRPHLRMLSLIYKEVDTLGTEVESLHYLARAVKLSVLVRDTWLAAVELIAEDVDSRSRRLVFKSIAVDRPGVQNPVNALSQVWKYINQAQPHLCTLKLTWVLRAVLLDGRIIAPSVCRIHLVFSDSETNAQRGTGLPEDSLRVGQPSFPNLEALQIEASASNTGVSTPMILSKESVDSYAAAVGARSTALVGLEVVSWH